MLSNVAVVLRYWTISRQEMMRTCFSHLAKLNEGIVYFNIEAGRFTCKIERFCLRKKWTRRHRVDASYTLGVAVPQRIAPRTDSSK